MDKKKSIFKTIVDFFVFIFALPLASFYLIFSFIFFPILFVRKLINKHSQDKKEAERHEELKLIKQKREEQRAFGYQKRQEQKAIKEQEQKEWLSRTFETCVAGTSLRQKEIENIVKEVINNGFETYGGFDASDIKELFSYDEPVWEIYDFYLDVELVPESDNIDDASAIKVMYKDVQLGYVPSDDSYMYYENKDHYVSALGWVKGGKFKYLDINENDKDIVRIARKNYSISLYMEFDIKIRK